ncbi:MAG: malonate transporter subunit MadL, partial [Bacteroidota bacterium]
MYIPVIVAMAATQNVHAALSGGMVALLAGTAATLAGFAFVPILAKIGRPTSENS